MLELSGLRCRRGRRLLFSDLSCVVPAGRLLQIVGPNGSGKTSLLRIICGLLAPDAGRVSWDHQTPVPPHALLYLGHSVGLKSALSPVENLRLDAALHGAQTTPAQALEVMGVASCANQPVCNLSAGQQRLVSLARLCTRKAPLWLLDEPYALLDATARSRVRDRIEAHCRRGGIVVLALHEYSRFTVPVIQHRLPAP